MAKTWTSETLEQGRIRQMKNFTILTIKPIYAWDFIVVGFIVTMDDFVEKLKKIP